MTALTIKYSEITRKALLMMAEEIRRAWIGIRIVACLFLSSGWKSTHVEELFGLTRWSVVKWISKVKMKGLEGIEDGVRTGRPSQFDNAMEKGLDKALSKSPKEFGIQRVRWDGVVVAEYLKRFHGIEIHMRQAQRWIRNLGYSLRQPTYRYVQATK
ncbi:MAG: winged helix-turn-helix domain-containing protein [Thermodesulfovibrionales bacterium]